jgi:flagellar basal body-associated protein FliL
LDLLFNLSICNDAKCGNVEYISYSSFWPCGSGCYQYYDGNYTCVEDCPYVDDYHSWNIDIDRGICPESVECRYRFPDSIKKSCQLYGDEACYYYEMEGNKECLGVCPPGTEAERDWNGHGKEIGECVNTACSKKTPSDGSCGDSCFFYNNHCFTSCPDNTEPLSSERKCSAKKCEKRVFIDDDNLLCKMMGDIDKCYYLDISSKVDVNHTHQDCFSKCPIHYKSNDLSKKCERVKCEERIPDKNELCSLVTDSSVNCFRINAINCGVLCFKNYKSGYCFFGYFECIVEECEERSPFKSSCSLSGDDKPCYVVGGDSCTSACPSHTSPTDNKICEVKNCSSRTPLAEIENPCSLNGDACFFVKSSNICVEKCPDHTSTDTSGILICRERTCLERTPNPQTYSCQINSKDDCGYYDGKCSKCSSSHFNIINGICGLKTCDERLIDSESSYICGDIDCYKSFDGKKCVSDCGDNSVVENRICACETFYSLSISSRKCELIDCPKRNVVNGHEDGVCGNNCYYESKEGKGCTHNCSEGKIPNELGICVAAVKNNTIYIGGINTDDKINCGTAVLGCSSILYAITYRLKFSEKQSSLLVQGNSELGGLIRLKKGIVLKSVGKIIVTVLVKTESDYIVIDTGDPILIENILFSGKCTSNLIYNFISISSTYSLGGVDSPNLDFKAVFLSFSCLNLKSSLMVFKKSLFHLTGMVVNMGSKNNSEKMKKLELNGDNICMVEKIFSGSMNFDSSNGIISNCIFKNSNIGGLVCVSSSISLQTCKFEYNIINSDIYNYKLYPNLRFNVFVDEKSSVFISGIETDTLKSPWINVEGNGKLSGDELVVSSPLFTPSIRFVELNLDSNTPDYVILNIIGEMLFPCNLNAHLIINESSDVVIPSKFNVEGINESSISVILPSKDLQRVGKYFVYLSYGNNNLLTTEKFSFYEVEDSNVTNLENKSKNIVAIIIIVVVVAVVIIGGGVVFLSLFFYRKFKKQKKNKYTISEYEENNILSNIGEESNETNNNKRKSEKEKEKDIILRSDFDEADNNNEEEEEEKEGIQIQTTVHDNIEDNTFDDDYYEY